jgi:hypothetical protein
LIDTYNFDLNGFYGFAVTKSLFAKSKYTIIGILQLLAQKKFNISQKIKVTSKCKLKSIKQISKSMKYNIISKVNLNCLKKMKSNPNFAMYIGKYTLLNKIDNMTLGTLDLLTLGKIDIMYGEGMNLQIAKQFKSSTNSVINATVNLSLLKFYRLKDFDNSILNLMDNTTLGNLDKIFLE